MPVPIQVERRLFSDGVVESISEFAKANSFRAALETWLVPGYEGVLGEFGPTVNKETDTTSPPKVVSGIEAKDSSGNILQVVHDIQNGKVHKIAAGVLGTELKASTSTTTPMAFVVYNDKILCFDGVTTPFQIVISSEAVSDIGLARPDIDPDDTPASGDEPTTALTGSGTGNVKGIVKYYVSEITGTTPSIVESSLSLAFGQIDAGGGDQVTITFPNDAEWNSKTFYLYRTAANREAPNFVDDIVVGASGGSFVDNIVDDELGDLPRFHGDQPPAGITAAAVYNDVVYGLAANTLYYSDPGQEESWWTAVDGNSFDLGETGGLGKALYVESDGVVAFKEGDIVKLMGSGPADYRLVPAVAADGKAAKAGTPSSISITSIQGGAFFYYDNGFHVYSMGRVVNVGEAIERMFFSSGTFLTNESTTVVAYDPRFRTVYCGVTVSADPLAQVTAAGLLLVFDAKNGRWRGVGAQTTRIPTGFLYSPTLGAMYGFIYTDEVPGAGYECNSLVDGQVLDTPTDTTLETTGGAVFQVPRFFGGLEFNEKRFLWLEVEAEGPASAGTIKAQYAINGGSFSTADSDTLTAGRTKYRFNIGEYGREMDVKMNVTTGFRIFDMAVAFQEFPSKSV